MEKDSKRSEPLRQLFEKGQAQWAEQVHPAPLCLQVGPLRHSQSGKLLVAQPLQLAGLFGDSASIEHRCHRWQPGCDAPRENVFLAVDAIQWVRELGSLSGDSTAALPVRRFRRVFTTPVCEEEGVSGSTRSGLFCGSQFLRKLDSQSKSLNTGRDILPEHPDLGFLALLCKGWTFEYHVVWGAKSFLAKGTSRVFVVDPRTAIIHPETAAGSIDDRPRRVGIFGCQSAHGPERRAVQATLDAMEVWASLNHRLHDAAVTGCHHKVIRIFPADSPSGTTPGGHTGSGGA
eukprot:364424-Amphidinium_carterae.2